MENILYVANKIKEIEEFIKNHNDTNYDDVYEHVDKELEYLKYYARMNNVPLLVTTEDIINKYREEVSSSYEEESSSYYYEEEESSYYEE